MLVILVIVLALVCLYLLFRIRSMQAAQKVTVKTDLMKTAFIKALAREIRTPLHSVSGLAEVIAKDDLYLSKGEKKNISAQIRYNADLIATLLEEVTYFSSRGEGKELVMERFSPNLLCQRCIDANFANLKEGVKLCFRRGLNEDFFVTSDARIIELVLNKLVRSACIFTEKGEVGVGYQCDTGSRLLTLYVEDTGVGVPIQEAENIFGRFVKLDSFKEGIGLGLPLSRKLAEQLGGTVALDTSYTNGARFIVTLPLI